MPTRPRWPGPSKRERPARERIRRSRGPQASADGTGELYALEAETHRREQVDSKLEEVRRRMESAEGLPFRKKGRSTPDPAAPSAMFVVLGGACVLGLGVVAWWVL